jgi:hypothetical protein
MFSKRTFVAFWFSSFTLFGLPVPQDQSDQQTTPAGPIQRVYVEERTTAGIGDSVHCDLQGSCFSHESENAQAVSLEVKTKCPAALASTDNRGMADYYLRISPESSIMYRRSGEIAYTFSAKFNVSNLTKGICAFAKHKAPVEMDSPIDPQ